MIAGFALLIATALYRLIPVFLGVTTVQNSWLPGFSPLAAMMLCGSAFLPKRAAIAVPFAALLITDTILNVYYGMAPISVGMLVNAATFAAIAAVGWRLRQNASAKTMIPAAIGSAFFFYVVSNSYAWATIPEYPGTFAGWIQSLTTGLPGFAPTWTFLRNELVSNVVFTALFLACMNRNRAELPATEPAPVHI